MPIASTTKVARRRNALARWLSLCAKICFLAIIADGACIIPSGGIGGVIRDGRGWMVAALVQLTVVAMLVMSVSFLLTMRRRWRVARVDVDDERLSIDGRAIGRVDNALVQGSTLEVIAPNGDVYEVETGDRAVAASMAASLGFGVAGRPVAYDLASRFNRFLHIPFAILCWIFAEAVTVMYRLFTSERTARTDLACAAIAVIVTWAFYALLSRRRRGPVVTVARDGVRIEKASSRADSSHCEASSVRAKSFVAGRS
jgi:hypothetical protein